MVRWLVLGVALLFVLALALLTLDAVVSQGLSGESILAAFVVLLLGVGVIGALFNPPR
jgi:hypothetical protein